ncbi:hypothetical protein [Maribacter sp. 2-571]|uniref:hypothetical protein n=1 Tax=Maribacter sp. 2-571 TaxID=3417569 RepID=UPI003D33F955
MKTILVLVLFGFFVGCISNEKEVCRKGLSDNDYDFLKDVNRQSNRDYLETIVDFKQFGSYSKNKWLREPLNLNIFYGSLKAVGLQKFISKDEFNKPLFVDHWTETVWGNKSLNQILQDLISSYSDTTGVDKYYMEFWNRRKAENNEKVVYDIFRDIYISYNHEPITEEIGLVSNPKIVSLLEFEIKLKHSDSTNVKKITIAYFNYLKRIGLYSSANNLLRYEREVYYNSTKIWDRDYEELIKTIETDSVDCDTYWNWRENAKWFNEVYDYGP